jgi:hypothetical protein
VATSTAGAVVTVTWGEEVLQPVQYNGFRVGPITVSMPVLSGESIAQAYERVWQIVDGLGQRQFQAKLDGWKARLREAAAEVRK